MHTYFSVDGRLFAATTSQIHMVGRQQMLSSAAEPVETIDLRRWLGSAPRSAHKVIRVMLDGRQVHLLVDAIIDMEMAQRQVNPLPALFDQIRYDPAVTGVIVHSDQTTLVLVLDLIALARRLMAEPAITH